MFKELSNLQSEAANMPGLEKESRPSYSEGYKTFSARTKLAVKHIIEEKEIITFALMQWVIIGFAYYLWVQFLGWIPESVWEDEEALGDLTLNIAFLVWSFLVVGAASYPLGILSGCIGASHFLRQRGEPSTIAGCLQIVTPQAWSLWIYQWFDAWVTVKRIFGRLPKKGGRSFNPLAELLYYAWKVASLGILPSLVNNRSLISAGKESLKLLWNRPKDVLLLRAGYSLVCWIIGVGGYVGAILFLAAFGSEYIAAQGIFQIYLLAGVPILVTAGLINLFVRPLFILASCDLYLEFVREEKLYLARPAPVSRINSSLVAVIFLLVIIGSFFVLAEITGLIELLRIE